MHKINVAEKMRNRNQILRLGNDDKDDLRWTSMEIKIIEKAAILITIRYKPQKDYISKICISKHNKIQFLPVKYGILPNFIWNDCMILIIPRVFL